MSQLTAVPDYKPTPADTRLERLMSHKLKEYEQCQERLEKKRLWAVYTDLHARRSPEYVAFLEKQKGLLR